MENIKNSRRKRVRKRFIIESVVILLIILSPFIFSLHSYLSRDSEATLNIFGFIIDRNGFPNIRTHVWFLLGKIVPLYLLIIWFFTSKQWWYHIILIPILMYAFQTFELIYGKDNTVDTENLFWLLPVCMVVIPFVYLIRIRLYDKHVYGIDLEAMDMELKMLKEKQGIPTDTAPKAASELEDHEEPQSFADQVNEKLSTQNLEERLKHFQSNMKNWLHLKL
tara:strand:+ start:165 stop:830 length:666 start_codon:yes stop_codon:yes gene_type:complete